MRNPLAPSEDLPTVALPAAMRFVLAGMVVGAALGSEELRTWTTYLPLWLNPLSNWLFVASDGWNEAMKAVGATEFFNLIREAIRWLQGLQG